MGLGLMGHGIGLVSAQAGYDVVAVEAKPDALDAGKKRIDGSLKKLLSKVRACGVVWVGGNVGMVGCKWIEGPVLITTTNHCFTTRARTHSRWRRGS